MSDQVGHTRESVEEMRNPSSSEKLGAERARLRNVFFTEDRVPEIVFFTTSLEKYLQARLVFDKSGLSLRQYKSRTNAYEEDYSGSKEHLLERAIEEVTQSLGRNSFLFIEDTSVRIEALSEGDIDFPGLRVKEWFAQTSFGELNQELRRRGSGRRAVVKSGIALHVPGLKRPVFFAGETVGTVADQAPGFEESPNYPWLTPRSFNGWFIPDGADMPLGALSIEESWRYDFRVKSLTALIDRIEEYTAALNAPSNAYRRRRVSGAYEALPLFPTPTPTAVIVGLTCAGKTTFGEIASRKHNCRVFEASSVLRMVRESDNRNLTLFPNASVDAIADNATTILNPAEQARQVLSAHGNDVVARKILDAYEPDADRQGLVITGFRLVEEVDALRQQLPNTKIVLIQAGEKIRYERLLRRNRYDANVRTLEDFRELDEQQRRFGLLRVAEDFADVRILNEGTLVDFENQVDAVLSRTAPKNVVGIATSLQPRFAASRNQVYRCLAVLAKDQCSMTTEEIENGTALTGLRILHNNVNKVLKRVPELATRLGPLGTADRVRYQITSAGLAYVRLVERQSDAPPAVLPDR